MKIPDRWNDYEAVGQPIAGTKFISFKVPLSKCEESSLSESEIFTPSTLLERIHDQEKSLGLVIDLTNTQRYYRPQELLSENVKYKKIFTEGHQVPSLKVQRQFFRVVDKFLRENKENDNLLGVHCTHGVNRTGYLVCRYLIQRLNYDPEEAIEAFNKARGHKIERENYLNDLKYRKYEQIEETNDDYDAYDDLFDDRRSRKPRHRHDKSRRPRHEANGSQQGRNQAFHQRSEAWDYHGNPWNWQHPHSYQFHYGGPYDTAPRYPDPNYSGPFHGGYSASYNGQYDPRMSGPYTPDTNPWNMPHPSVSHPSTHNQRGGFHSGFHSGHRRTFADNHWQAPPKVPRHHEPDRRSTSSRSSRSESRISQTSNPYAAYSK